MLSALLLTVAPLKPHPEEGATRNSYLRVEAGNAPKQMSNLRRLAPYIVLSRRLLNFVLVIRTQMLLLLLSRFSRVRLCATPDGSPPGSAIPRILQARTLEWVAISFSNA